MNFEAGTLGKEKILKIFVFGYLIDAVGHVLGFRRSNNPQENVL
jgi:hypothetical protein